MNPSLISSPELFNNCMLNIYFIYKIQLSISDIVSLVFAFQYLFFLFYFGWFWDFLFFLYFAVLSFPISQLWSVLLSIILSTDAFISESLLRFSSHKFITQIFITFRKLWIFFNINIKYITVFIQQGTISFSSLKYCFHLKIFFFFLFLILNSWNYLNNEKC